MVEETRKLEYRTKSLQHFDHLSQKFNLREKPQ